MTILWFVRRVRWALSPLDYHAHLLPEGGEHPLGGLTARCGHRLPAATAGHAAPPARRCPPCDLIFHADVVNSPPRFARPHQLPPMLDGTQLADWMALSRVHAGRVTRHRGEYLDGGLPMPGYLVPGLLFDALLLVGLLTPASPDEDGLAALSLTDAGRARYQELRQRRERRP